MLYMVRGIKGSKFKKYSFSVIALAKVKNKYKETEQLIQNNKK